MKIASYKTDLSAPQWHLLRRFLPAAKKRGRPRTSLREVLNAILYLIKTGAHWRFLPKNFPPWQTVYHHFRQWTRNGLLARLNDRLRAKVRQAAGKHSQPTAASLDSQTVRASAHGGEVGYDAAKKTKGRKRFLPAALIMQEGAGRGRVGRGCAGGGLSRERGRRHTIVTCTFDLVPASRGA